MVGVTSRKTPGLTPDDLESLSAGLAAGKRVTVYLRDPMPSLNLDAGTSARVVSIDGSTLTVSPKGVDDQLPFEADELQKTRVTPTTATPTRRPPGKAAPAPSRPAGSSRTVATEPKSESEAIPEAKSATTIPAQPRPAPAKAPRRPKASTAAVSVTITSTGESAWTVSISHGAKKQGRPTEVTADRVARAMHELGDDAAITAVDGVIESARAAAKKRIDELSHELETARAALAHLEGQERGN
ncbi:DUF6319 family protein [Gordonia hankookensis]|uniref:Translation initiation factor n=1 Tax=Gordonia hankookensis TaxID=589403 RepID=A0ABR7WHA4_9ACTN|nr:DUF6319 family protein [Gordonia hankookensis]MBD1322148.1 hypothetical protein [Gordonia hankookensis]